VISLESEVLQRHLPFFNGKSILLAGGINDDFPQILQKHCQSVQIWSWYFDYAKTQSAVNFEVEFQPQADLIIYYWTKNKQEVNFQLMQLLAKSKIGQEVLIIGENRCGVRSAEKLLEPYGEIGKIDSARRCGLYSLPGVFSANELDSGTSLLLSTLTSPIQGKVLDIGCGAGVIGSMIKKYHPKADVTMTDIHAMAIQSARQTLAENQLEGNVIASDVFSHIEGKFDLIISNPPFHDGIDTAYRAVKELIQQAKWHLTAGGELRIVANAFLPYPDLLAQHFGKFDVLAQTTKFKVYSVRN